MKQLNAEFKLGAVKPEQFPNTRFVEIAFSGRSNVGKSSLLNSLVQNKHLAKISSTPGKTQQINFFLVEDKWMIADLPGFGYAKISKSEREKWLKLNMEYLEKREQLKLTCFLVDSRHDPMELDLKMMEWLENNQKQFLIILTKCDKITKKLVDERVEQIKAFLANCQFNIDVLPYSATTGFGRENLGAIIKRLSEN